MDGPFLDRLIGMPPQMVFILGPHRSGTTWLQKLLAQSGAFNVLTTYDVAHHESLLANRIEGREAEVRALLDARLGTLPDRGIDGLAVGADEPSEYGITLGLRLYEARLTPERRDRFELLCAKKHFLDGGQRPLLLKEPSEFYGNVRGLREMFPQARYVCLHRHPLQVLDSQVRAWRMLVARPDLHLSLVSPDYRALMADPLEVARYQAAYESAAGCEQILRQLIDACLRYLEERPRQGALEETYEALCATPRRALARLSQFLEVPLDPPADVAPRLREPLPMVREIWTRHVSALVPYLDYFGYSEQP